MNDTSTDMHNPIFDILIKKHTEITPPHHPPTALPSPFPPPHTTQPYVDIVTQMPHNPNTDYTATT
jgi:hypothetical protein